MNETYFSRNGASSGQTPFVIQTLNDPQPVQTGTGF